MTTIFISHSNAEPDRGEASSLRDALLGAGYENVFLDLTGLHAMAEWEAQLHRQLAVADVLVYLHSRASAESAWCHREIGVARYRRTPVLVLPVEDVLPTALLGTIQQLPFRADRDQRLAEALAALRYAGFGPEEGYEWDIEASPYPGLAPFEADRAAVFFGREQEVRDLEAALDPSRDEGAVVLVVGASGTGKSSLVRAGLVPRLRRQPRWSVLGLLEPNHAFRDRLASVLADWSEEDAGPPGLEVPPAPVLVVDQAERLLVGDGTSAPGAGALEGLARALATVPRLQVVMVTKTADARLTTPLERWLVAKHLVVGLGRTELARVITEPAARSGVEIEPALVTTLVEETPSGEALPLLAFTLAEIWEERASPTTLALADYIAVGGVTRILDEAARSVLRSLPLQTEDEVVATVLGFVSVDATGQPISVPRRLGSFTETQRRVVDAFVHRRLLTVKDVENESDPAVTLTHDALMTAWESLAAAIEREREELLLESDVRREAARGPEEWTLLRGPRLAAAERRFAEAGVDPTVAAYLAAARAAEDEQSATRERAVRLTVQRRRWTVVAAVGAVVALVASGGVVLLQRQKAEIEALQMAASSVSLAQTRRDGALRDALQAVDRLPGTETYSALLTILAQQPGARRFLTTAGAKVHDVAMGAGGEPLLGTPDGVERVDTAARTRTPVVAGAGAGTAIAASADGRVTVLANVTGGVVTSVDGVTMRIAETSGTPVIAMSGNGERIAVTDLTQVVRVLDPTGAVLGSWQRPDHVHDLAMSADGRLLASVDQSDEVTLTEVDTGSTSRVPLAGASQLTRVAISPDGRRVVAMSATEQVWRASVSAPHAGADIPLSGKPTTIAVLGEDVLGVGLEDGRIVLVALSSGNVLATFGRHEAAVVALAGTPDRLVSVDDRGEAVLWDGVDAVPSIAQVRGGEFLAAGAADDGGLAALGSDLTLRAWRADGAAREPRPQDRSTEIMAVGPSGRLALATVEGTVVTTGADLAETGEVAVGSATNGVTALAWVGDAVVAGTATGELVLLGDGPGGVRARTDTRHREIRALTALGGGAVAWGTADGAVGTWRPDGRGAPPVTLGEKHSRMPVLSLAYDPDRRTLYSGGDDRIALAWDLEGSAGNPKEVATHTDAVVGVLPVAAGGQRWLVTVSQDRTIRVRDLETGGEVGPLIAPGNSRFTWAGGSGDGRLATLDDLGRLIVWDLSPDALERAACRTLAPGDTAGGLCT